MALTLLVTDEALTPIGRPITGWAAVDVTVRHNTPGSGTVTVPARPDVVEQLAAGRRLVIVRRAGPGDPGQVFAAGPIEAEPGELAWSADPTAPGGGAGPGALTVRFATDDVHVVERVTYPDPTQPATAQTAAATWSMTGNAETVMRALVNANAGPGALLARRAPSLTLGPVAGVGGAVSISTRFQPLGDELRSLALAGGGLGWRVRQSGAALAFDVFAPVDRTGTVRFSRGLGNLRAFTYSPSSPTCTAAIVAGQGEGTARNIRERVDAAAVTRWRRVERFIDQRQTNVAAELDQAGDEALTDGAEQVGLSTVTVDTPRQRYGDHYELGDLVAVELAPGLVVPDVVTAAQLTATPKDGERVTCTVGNRPASSEPDWLTAMRGVYRRLSILEGV